MAPEPPYQSLYRRFRPNRFAEVRGQDHVTVALRNAVRDQRVGHGYLFSGPRGTGKTSTARILSKALNCEKLDDGEPCGVCESCVAITAQTSFAVIELDAASNNGVEAMRDLVARAALGAPGLRKVYIIDEVHMLSVPASNTLLKTLEEPPAHVVFVLATTDPQKVLPTIRSRVQHFEFHLLGADTLGELVRSVNADAALGLSDDDLNRIVRRGAGSARDALSVLDQAAALGGAEEDVPVAAEVLHALVARDPARALAAVAAGVAAGRDPRRLAEETLGVLRNAFLAGRAPTLVDLPPVEFEQVAEHGRALGPAALVRAMETVGEALAGMREALDPRVSLEVALVRITAPEADASPSAMLERIERLEQRFSVAGEPAAPAAPARPQRGAPAAPAAPTGPGGPARGGSVAASGAGPPPDRQSGRALGAFRDSGGRQTGSPAAPASPPRAEAPAQTTESSGGPPTRDELTKAWGDHILANLSARLRARFSAGRFVAVESGAAVFALPNPAHRDQCVPLRGEVEQALAAYFGRPVRLELVAEQPELEVSMADLRRAPKGAAGTPADRVKNAFPGAEEVDP